MPGVDLAQMRTSWSFDDLMTAHDVLDAIDAAEAEAARKARLKAEAQRRAR